MSNTPHPMAPSRSTVASAAGGSIATIGLWILETSLGAPVPAPVAGAITVLVTIVAGYFLPGGRSQDVT